MKERFPPSGRFPSWDKARKLAVFRDDLMDLLTSNDSPLLATPPSRIHNGPSPEELKQLAIHPLDSNLMAECAVRDINRLADNEPSEGKGLESDYIKNWLRDNGYDPNVVLDLPPGRKFKLAKQLLRHFHELKADGNKIDAELAKLRNERGSLVKAADLWNEDVLECARRLGTGEFKMERPQGPSLHHFYDYVKSIEVADIDDLGLYTRLMGQIRNGEWQSFVVEHDWATAFRGSGDFDEGDFLLPYDKSCFEFRINGMRVMLMVEQDTMTGALVLGLNGRWYVNADSFKFVGGKLESIKMGEIIPRAGPKAAQFLNLLGDQVRAVCIMLDAKVAERDTIRAPAKLNEQRARKGKLPLRDHHVVCLSRRYRAKAMDDHVPVPGTRRRCHLRRGHWRHYSDHRTWINWMMVGDPDLGFVDKHYKL